MSTETSRVAGPTSPSRATDPARVSIVLPVYNEARNIPVLFEELREVIDSPEMEAYRPCEVIWVEDGSTDGTSELIDDYANAYPHVRAIHLRRNWGQSAALQAGFDHATGDIIVPMDADLQNDPHDIPRLLKRLDDGYDCVSGWRRDRHDPLTKRVPSRVQTTLAKLTGPDINDFGCTLKAYRADALHEIEVYGEGHRYIPAKLYDRGYRVTELPVNHRPRVHGNSRYGLGRLLRGFSDLVWHVLWYRYSSRPFHLFGGIGFLVITLGLLVGGSAVLINWLDPTVGLQPFIPQLLLAVGTVLFGLLTVMFGTIMEFLTTMYYNGDESEYRIARVVE